MRWIMPKPQLLDNFGFVFIQKQLEERATLVHSWMFEMLPILQTNPPLPAAHTDQVVGDPQPMTVTTGTPMTAPYVASSPYVASATWKVRTRDRYRNGWVVWVLHS